MLATTHRLKMRLRSSAGTSLLETTYDGLWPMPKTSGEFWQVLPGQTVYLGRARAQAACSHERLYAIDLLACHVTALGVLLTNQVGHQVGRIRVFSGPARPPAGR